ncbi:ABC transporter permease [Ammonicoccus fulvus]|uniref:ABC transporter permease n=1 Tax=Ammonicoccus fulvus TaxID=3138240 RepID=A0ABZ3FS87_9ACTN
MLTRMIRADLRRSRAVSITLLAIVTLAAALAAMSAGLIVRTTTAIDHLWDTSKPPHAVQMHAGEADPAAIDAWVQTRPAIEDHHVMRTVKVPPQSLTIAGVNQGESALEPAFVTSPQRFDLLLDSHGNPAAPGPGEIVLPVHYRAIGAADIGDVVAVQLDGSRRELRVVDFARDVQMNPSMVTSKRFVVHPDDFAALDAQLEEVEYLIEFRLHDPSAAKAELDAYRAAGLPASGVAVDHTIFRLMNALSTLLLAGVALLVAGLLVVVAGLALRLAILAALENDLPELATLKAIGARPKAIRRLYVVKYAAIAAAGALLGYALSFPILSAVSEPVLLYLGQPALTLWDILVPILAAAAVGAMVVLLCLATLRRLSRISATQALRTGAAGQLKPRRHRLVLSRNRWLPTQAWLGLKEAMRPANALLVGVVATATFLVLLPLNAVTTLADPGFSSYLGVGQADVLIDTQDDPALFEQVRAGVAADPDVTRSTGLATRRLDVLTPDGEWESLLVESGDHTMFPLHYSQGYAPAAPGEIAFSHNQAAALKAGLGDRVTLKSTDGGAAHWHSVSVDLAEGVDAKAKADALAAAYPGAKALSVAEASNEAIGATLTQLRLVSGLSAAVAFALVFLVTALFAVLVVSREADQIATQRAIGARASGLVGQYLIRFVAVGVFGVLIGVVLAQTLGQLLTAGAVGLLGAPGLVVLVDPLLSWLAVPALLIVAVVAATLLALGRIPTITVLDPG